MTTRRKIAIIVAMLILFALFAIFILTSSITNAAVTPPPAWLVKSNDLAVIGAPAAQFTWVACGISTYPADIDRVGKCKPGQDPVYANYATLQRDIAAGRVTRGMTVIFDQEGWSITPSWEREHPLRYLRLAALLAHGNGIKVIEAPVGSSLSSTGILPAAARRAQIAQQLTEDAYAARFADYVEMQIQYLDGNPAKYIAVAGQVIAAIRKVSKVPVLAGLATDAGGVPVTAAQMLAEYQGVQTLVAGYWLNANLWAAPKGKGCAPKGCPLTARAFLAAIAAS